MRERRSAGEHQEPAWPDFAPGTQVVGFTVEALLATGSFGTVYRAKRDGRLFAIKLVPKGSRGEREVDALRRAQFPNVVAFRGYGLWPEDKPRFMVLAMELVEGRTLEVWAREENPCALVLVRQVLLPFAGVVHRDVKESNILIRDADGAPVLVDFGSAGYEGAPRLTGVLPPGTPEYRGPEVLRFARESESLEPYQASPGDDLWALGVTLYIVLTRQLPFGDRRSPGMNHAILHEHPQAPHELNPRVPPALGELCLRMLEKAPEARYTDTEALAEALEKVALPGAESWHVPLFPGRGKSAAPAARTRWWGRRWPWAVLASGLTSLFFLIPSPAPRRLPLEVAPIAPRDVSPPPPPMSQAGSSRELVRAHVTGEVGRGAGPSKSPIPAPVARATHSEEDPMLKSKKALCLAATTTLLSGTACVSTPPLSTATPDDLEALRRPDCPEGFAEGHKRLGIWKKVPINLYMQPHEEPPELNPSPVSLDTTMFEATNLDNVPGGALPGVESMIGARFVWKGRVYIRMYLANLVGYGEPVPVCMEAIDTTRVAKPDGSLHLGVPLAPGSTSEKLLVKPIFTVRAVESFQDPTAKAP
jgi:serine/threonine-protein kinase